MKLSPGKFKTAISALPKDRTELAAIKFRFMDHINENLKRYSLTDMDYREGYRCGLVARSASQPRDEPDTSISLGQW